MQTKPKVSFFNTHLMGGAANAAINIFNGICSSGEFNSKFFLLNEHTFSYKGHYNILRYESTHR